MIIIRVRKELAVSKEKTKTSASPNNSVNFETTSSFIRKDSAGLPSVLSTHARFAWAANVFGWFAPTIAIHPATVRSPRFLASSKRPVMRM